MTSARLETDLDGIAIIHLDSPDRSVNTLSQKMWSDLADSIQQVERSGPNCLIVTSAKPSTFIVGADLYELRDMSDVQLDQYLIAGLKILDRLEQLPIPTVAAINGACLGGGLELALACKSRICADDPSILIGLPEVKLGFVPGWGGILRLTRLIGLRQALPMLISGDSVNPQSAIKAGIVDAVVARDELAAGAREYAHQMPVQRSQFELNAIDRQKTIADTVLYIGSLGGDQMPASRKLIEIIQQTFDSGPLAGLDAARQGLIELRRTEAAQKLLRRFFDRQAAKKPRAAGK